MRSRLATIAREGAAVSTPADFDPDGKRNVLPLEEEEKK